MAGVLPIFLASTGATPQAAPDAAGQPSGTDGAFAALLAEASDRVSTGGEPLLPTEGMVTPAQVQFAGQPEGSAVQRLKLALAANGDLPVALGEFTGLATVMASLSPAPAPAPQSVPVPEAGTDSGEAAPAAQPAAVSGGVTKAAEAQPQPSAGDDAPALEPQPQLALAPTAPRHAALQDAANLAETGQDEAVQDNAGQDEAGQDTAGDRPALATGQLLPQPNGPAVHGMQPSRTPDLTAVADAGQPAAETPAEPAVLAMAAFPAAAPAEPEAPASNNSLSAPATTDAAPITPARPAPAQTAPAPAAPGTEAQPVQNEAATAAHTAATADRSAAMAAMTMAPAPAAQAQAVAEPLVAPAAADPAALAALAPAAGRAEPARKTVDTPAVKADAQASVSAAQVATPEAAKPEGQTPHPLFAKDQPAMDGARSHSAQRLSDDAPLAQPQADTAGSSNAQPAPADRTAALTTEKPAGQAAPQTGAPEGVQPVAAQPAAHASAANAQTAQPHPAVHVRVAAPHQVPDAVGMAISRHVNTEATEFTLRLDPADLGRVEVKLDIGKDGKAVVSIQADNASTFDLLRRDSQVLERALQDAGLKLDSGGLNFSLRQQDGQGQQQFAGASHDRAFPGRTQEASLTAPEADHTPRPSRRSAAGLLDLSI